MSNVTTKRHDVFIFCRITETNIRLQASLSKASAKLEDSVKNKYKNYFNFDTNVSFVKPHQVSLTVNKSVHCKV